MSDFLGQLIDRSFGRADSVRPRPVALFEPSQPASGNLVPPDVEPYDAGDQVPAPASMPSNAAPAPRHMSPAAPSQAASTRPLRMPSPAPTAQPDVPPAVIHYQVEPTAAGEPPALPRVAPPAMVEPTQHYGTRDVVVERVLEEARQASPPRTAAPTVIESTLLQPILREVVVERTAEAPPLPAATPREVFPPHVLSADVRDQAGSAPDAPRPPRALKPLTEAAPPVVVQPRMERRRREPAAPETSISATRPTIQVTIGRVEVRAIPAPAPPGRRPHPQPTVMTLDEYLKQRAGGGTG
jgi:hypothetical protein